MPRRRHASLTSQGRCKDALFRVSAGRKRSVINSPGYIPRDRVLGAQSGPSTRGHPGETVRSGRVPVFTENGVWSCSPRTVACRPYSGHRHSIRVGHLLSSYRDSRGWYFMVVVNYDINMIGYPFY
ncbi:hypothetical protein TIFTF001_052651 [Ficus carica]|uniref:Uncharacterized protein n=1 Tax=Ficus carica TaxID=3494 RepID=A0AA88EAW1_FICCA|nr:hypothetical protein TIFTF001_052651 [Ficus carica]